jgi:hypothetical protein
MCCCNKVDGLMGVYSFGRDGKISRLSATLKTAGVVAMTRCKAEKAEAEHGRRERAGLKSGGMVGPRIAENSLGEDAGAAHDRIADDARPVAHCGSAAVCSAGRLRKSLFDGGCGRAPAESILEFVAPEIGQALLEVGR